MKPFPLILTASGATLLLLGCQSTSSSAENVQESNRSSQAKVSAEEAAEYPVARTATLWVKGLACPYCVNNIDRQIVAMPGVERVHIDLPTGKVRVALDAQSPATQAQLVKAIDDSGFTLDRIEMPQ